MANSRALRNLKTQKDHTSTKVMGKARHLMEKDNLSYNHARMEALAMHRRGELDGKNGK